MKSKLPKLFVITTVVAALFVCLAISAGAVDLNQLSYATNKDGTITITDCDEEAEGVLVIPEAIGGRAVTKIGENAFRNCEHITKITLPSTINEIYTHAFYNCASLEEINIPYGVTVIWREAFANCSSLKSISLPDTMTDNNVIHSLFKDCTSLSQVKLSAGMSSVPGWMFENCTSLQTVTIPSGVTTIGQAAFRGSGLTSITVPGSVTTIEPSAFNNCASLKSITLNEGLTTIKDHAFANCTSLKSIAIPDSVTTNPNSSIICEGCTSLETVMIGKGLGTLGAECFNGCTSLRTVYLNSGLTEIGRDAFNSCPALSDLYYCGTSSQWTSVKLETGNDALLLADVHYIDSFNDVQTAAWYGPAVFWAVGQNITNGVGNNAFAPTMTCTNAQVITFLYRAAGSPAVSGASALTNVQNPDVYYYNACVWAYQKGIITDVNFAPDGPATRSSFVTYLWRNEGKPSVSGGNNPFADVTNGSDYYTAVLWAYKNNITTGTSATTFSPDTICSRGQIVTFLYRYFG
ncbi:MAG: leucine-rich repeat protein [Oscillospiraceae bacterium]|nr:leucine-rich repeat protein [Oscillospiraceae bacterium]